MKEKQRISRFITAVTASAFCLSIGFLSIAAEKYRNVDTSLKVYDYAQLLSEEEEDALRERCLEAAEASACDVFVVTVDENNVAYETGDRTLSFLEDFGDGNGFGRGEGLDYVSFIIDMEERQYNIDVAGEHALRVFTTERQEAQKDRISSDMQNGDYNAAMNGFVDFVQTSGKEETAAFVGTEQEWEAAQRREKIRDIALGVGIALVIAAVSGLLAVLIRSKTSKTVHRAVDAYSYANLSTFHVTASKDQFLRHYSDIRVIPVTPNGPGGSGGGGHTATHSSFGGRSHGGGSSRGF